MTAINIGKGIELDVDFASMPQNALNHLLRIGARNVLMDSHASATHAEHGSETANVSRAMAEKKLAALMSGEVRVGGTSRETDPVRAEAIHIATRTIRDGLRAVKRPMKSDKHPDGVTPAQVREAAIRLIDKDATIMDTARKNVETAKTAAPTVDLSDLGL